MLKLDLTEQERNALVELINIAVQARGIQVAEAAVILVKKLQAAAAPPVEQPTEPPKVADAA